jgi:hypothetical protein
LEETLFRKTGYLIIVFSLLLTACSELISQPTPAPGEPNSASWEPAAGDDLLIKGEVTLTKTELLALESFPVQYMLSLSGMLPTPCHRLRVAISEPDDNDQINVNVYSLVDPAEICIQVLEKFESNIPLGSYSSGNYTVLVNGEPVGEINP